MINQIPPNNGPPQMVQQQPQQQHFIMQSQPQPQQQQPLGPPGQTMAGHIQQPGQMMPPQMNQRMAGPNNAQMMQQQMSQNSQPPPMGPGQVPQQQNIMNQDPMSALKTMTGANSMPQSMEMGIPSNTMVNVRHQIATASMPGQPIRGPSPRGTMMAGPGYMHPGQGNQSGPVGNIQSFGSPASMHAPSPSGGIMSNAGASGHHIIPGQSAGQWTPHPVTPSSAPSPRAPSIGSPANNYIYNSSLNTPNPMMQGASPAPNVMAVPSPGSMANEDTRRYQIKLNQLQKYVEPLKRMIDKYERTTTQQKEMSKFKQLYELIACPESNKVSLEALTKCESVLEKMEVLKSSKPHLPSMAPLQQQPSPIPLVDPMLAPPGSVGPPISTSVGSSANICQPLIDSIIANIKKPNFHSTLARTFSPACAALGIIPSHATNSLFPVDLLAEHKVKKSTLEDSDSKSVLQGEIAQLDHKFKVEEDPINHPGSSATQIVVNLESSELPFVPPLVVKIPEKYPQQPPISVTYTTPAPHASSSFNPDLTSLINANNNSESGESKLLATSTCDSSDFFHRIVSIFTLSCKKLPQSHSLTTLLLTWEASVRQACTSHCRNV